MMGEVAGVELLRCGPLCKREGQWRNRETETSCECNVTVRAPACARGRGSAVTVEDGRPRAWATARCRGLRPCVRRG